MTQSTRSKALIACAGSGKTTSLVSAALSMKGQRVLILTYTNENVDEIRRRFIQAVGCIPTHVHVISWFVFLLRDGVRPYQNHILSDRPVRSIQFEEVRNPFRKKEQYLTPSGDIYSDKVSEFVCEVDRASGGRVIGRLQRMYDHFLLDELQDLSGYDLDLLRLLFRSPLAVTLVGDPRQKTFSTNRASKNKRYKGSGIYDWLKEREAAGEVTVEDKTESYRCNQEICDFADAIYPEYPKTTSLNTDRTGHDGVFEIDSGAVAEYVATHDPTVLRYSKKTSTNGLAAFNIGACKGRTYDRVLIFPTAKMLAYLKCKDPAKAGDRSKFYVAVTRARYSVAFVVSRTS